MPTNWAVRELLWELIGNYLVTHYDESARRGTFSMVDAYPPAPGRLFEWPRLDERRVEPRPAHEDGEAPF